MSSRLSYGAMSQRPTIVTEVQKPSQRPCMIRLLREVCSQLIERKALSWGIIRKSACILAEITIRKSQSRNVVSRRLCEASTMAHQALAGGGQEPLAGEHQHPSPPL